MSAPSTVQTGSSVCEGYQVSGCSVFKCEMSSEVIGHVVRVSAGQRCTYGADLGGLRGESEPVSVGTPHRTPQFGRDRNVPLLWRSRCDLQPRAPAGTSLCNPSCHSRGR